MYAYAGDRACCPPHWYLTHACSMMLPTESLAPRYVQYALGWTLSGPRTSVQLASHVARMQSPTLARPQLGRRPSTALSSRLGSRSCPPAPAALLSLTRADYNS